jgi:transposase InsO family protein
MGKEVPMPWRETRVMDERMAFVVDVQRGEASLAELCRRYGISRKSGYKWLARHAAEGLDGLKDRSRAPHHHPQALEPDVAAAALAVRAKHPTWGPKKIRAWLGQHRGDLGIPAQSTIGVLLERHGLVQPRRPHRRVPLHPGPLRACERPNAVWGVDFKGWFVLGNGRRCDPLSLSDLASRYVLRLQVVERPDGAHVWPLLEAAFREFGLPEVIRSDNGPPFASTGVGGLSRLAVTLIKAGVTPERIAPGKPQQNGRHERLHRTVQEETARPPAFEARAQQRRFDAFRHRFNEERPHEALGLTPPAQHYHASPLSRPAALAGLRERSGGAPGAPEWRDQVARRAHLPQRGAHWRAGGRGRERDRRDVERALWPGRAGPDRSRGPLHQSGSALPPQASAPTSRLRKCHPCPRIDLLPIFPIAHA